MADLLKMNRVFLLCGCPAARVNLGIRTKFFVETRYHRMFTTNSPAELVPITFGVRW
jgi:hypothetical protein